MLGKPEKKQQMFNTLKAMFPHIDLSIVNQQLTFSQNLQNIVGQLGTPRLSQTHNQIHNMKQAVDKQQLKIQKSLVNQQDVLGNITNRNLRRQRNQKLSKNGVVMESIQEESSHYWQHEHSYFGGEEKNNQHKNMDYINDIVEDMWELGNQNMKDWFQH